MGSTSILLRVAPLRCNVIYIETHSTVQNVGFDDTDPKILGLCVNLLLIV